MSYVAKRKARAAKRLIIIMVVVSALASSGIVAALYSNYTPIVNDRDKTIKSLKDQVEQLTIENQTALVEEMNRTLTAQIASLQNQAGNYLTQIDTLNSQINALEAQLISHGNNTPAETAQIATYQKQVDDLLTQLQTKNDNINSLIRLSTIDFLPNFNDSSVWLEQTSANFTQISKETISAGTTMDMTGLNLIPGKAYFVTVDMVMHPPTNDTYTAYLYVNGDLNKTHYDTSYLYGNARWSWACLQTENDPRIFDNGQYPGSMALVFSGVLEIDLAGTLRMALTYNAYGNLRADLETGIYGWMYNGTTVNSVNSLYINSTMPFTGTFAIYNMQ